MSKNNTINTGEFIVMNHDSTISTFGIGSCVVISLYDDIAKVGGMLHSMLPTRNTNHQQLTTSEKGETIGKFVDEAIPEMLRQIKAKGASNIKAKIVGGASMFSVLSISRIGERNIEKAKEVLTKLCIEIENEEIGGTVGRSAKFNLQNGVMEIVIKM